MEIHPLVTESLDSQLRRLLREEGVEPLPQSHLVWEVPPPVIPKPPTPPPPPSPPPIQQHPTTGTSGILYVNSKE